MTTHNTYPQTATPEQGSEEFFRQVYGGVDQQIRSGLIERVGGNLPEHVRQVEEYGITKISGLFDDDQVAQMQEDVASWRATKEWNKDRHMGFDGNSGEAYLPTSKTISEAVTHPAILSVVAASFGQHPRMTFARTYSVDPIEPYYRRAFQWHHDGYSEHGYKAMILISDVPENGQAMRFAPGTNKQQWPTDTSRQTQFNAEFAETFDQYVCSGKAGDVFVFNPHSLHRGTRNNTVRRDVIVTNFQPGIARNYPLPGLHPDVVAGLSPYQKEVYRAGERVFEPVQESSFAADLAAHREKMSRLASEWVLPVEQIQLGLHGEIDPQITSAGERNRSIVAPSIPRHAENVTREDVDALQAGITANAPVYQAFLSSPDATAYVELLRAVMQDEWQRDLHGDLDLPIRMYHPNRDQRRDNAITQTRDQEGGAHFEELSARLGIVTPEELANTRPEGYVNTMDTLLSARDQLVADLAPYANDPNVAQKVDSYLCFAEDLQGMLDRAHSMPLIRRTLLFSYLTLAKVQELHGSLAGDEAPLAATLASQKENALRQYASLVAFDKLTQRQE